MRNKNFLASSTAVVECPAGTESPRPADPGKPPAGEVAVERYLSEEVVLRTSNPEPALLVLNDSYALGWTATVDGVETPILPANFFVRGVWLQPGEHQVRFTYRQPGLRSGAALAAGGLLILLGFALFERKRRRTKFVTSPPRTVTA